jgi:hypothetical protein
MRFETDRPTIFIAHRFVEPFATFVSSLNVAELADKNTYCVQHQLRASGEGTHVPRPEKQLAKGSFFRLKPFYDFWHCQLTEKIKAVPIALTLATGLSKEALSYRFAQRSLIVQF